MSRELTTWLKSQSDTTNNIKRRIADLETKDSVSSAYLEYYIQATRARSGVSAPTLALRAIGASGGVVASVDQFSKTVQQDVYFEWHIPYDCDVNTPAELHVMWIPGAAWTLGTYIWKAEYLVVAEGGNYSLGTPATLPQTVTPTSATIGIETIMGTIPLVADGVVYVHFYRDVADTGDDTGDVDFFEFKYRSNRRGSPT